MRSVLAFFGLAFASDVDTAKATIASYDDHINNLVKRLTSRERELVETKAAHALTQRESAAHARTAKNYAEKLAQVTFAGVDVGASCVGTLGPCGGKFSHYTLQLGIKNGDKYTAIELRRLAASNKNRATLEEIAGKINTAATPAPIAKTESLLRDATPAPGENVVAIGNGKPKGFA